MILFIHPGFSSFIEKDYRMLTKHFTVKDFYYQPVKTFGLSFKNQYKMFVWLSAHIRQAKAIYVWFADYHALLPLIFARIFTKKSILVLAGYDVASFPEIKYGSFSNPVRAFFAAYSIKYAKFVVPVDESLALQVKERVKKVTGKIIPIPFGFDPKQWFVTAKKENIVATVAIIDNLQRIKIKGIDFFIRVAEKLSAYRFFLIGINDHSKTLLDWPSNVALIPKVPIDKLRDFYSRAKVYVQFSISEGLPNVVCEAMLCECVPVGLRVGGIPSAIGDSGFILTERNVDKAVALVEKAMNSAPELGKKARQRIIELFAQKQREEKIISLLLGDDFTKKLCD